MPRNVATPEQTAAARSQVEAFSDVRSGRAGNLNRFSRTRPLSRVERQVLMGPVKVVYIYNISPIWNHRKDLKGLGALHLFARKPAAPYSNPVVLSKMSLRPYDGGNGIQRFMVEEPLEIAEDFLVCSPNYPMRPENNLLNFGAFYTVGEPIEDVPKRQEILDGAEFKHRTKCHEFVQHADALAGGAMRPCIVEVHKKCALYLQSVGEISELPDWVARRAKLNMTEECRFCGFENKRAVAVCRNCREVLDPELYAKLKNAKPEKKAN